METSDRAVPHVIQQTARVATMISGAGASHDLGVHIGAATIVVQKTRGAAEFIDRLLV